jgi:hypothetical protein
MARPADASNSDVSVLQGIGKHLLPVNPAVMSLSEIEMYSAVQ